MTKPIVEDPLQDLADLLQELGVDLNPSPPPMSAEDRAAIMAFLEVDHDLGVEEGATTPASSAPSRLLGGVTGPDGFSLIVAPPRGEPPRCLSS